MPHALRKIRPEEFTNWRIAVRRGGFNEDAHPDDIERLRTQRAEIDRLYGAFDGSQIVGTGGIDSHQLTVPGSVTVPAAGIAYVTTSPTHRRRGILREMMATLECNAREREEPVAILWAAQSGIYDRFGFGPATVLERWRIATDHAAFNRQAAKSSDEIDVRLVESDEAHRVIPQVYEARRLRQPGFVDVSESRWEYILFDAERVRRGASGYFYAIAERQGRPAGYAIYRIKRTGDFDLGTLAVWGLISTSDEAEAALWKFVLDMDLVNEVSAGMMPPDDPTWWRLVDPRRLQRQREDGLWLKLLDPARALAARRYAVEGALVVEVWDGESTGRFEIDGGPGGATCEPTRKTPDLAMRLADLSSAFLGEAHFVTMATAGRVEETTPRAARRADLMFGWSPRPWCPYFF